jgi:hypothetical protein
MINIATMSHPFCLLFEPIRRLSLNMLEIGFGCGHRVHGRGALMWSRFFKFMESAILRNTTKSADSLKNLKKNYP